MHKNITYSNKLVRLVYRLCVILLSIIVYCAFGAGFSYNFLILGILAEAVFSFKRIIFSIKMTIAGKVRPDSWRTGGRTVYVILIWCLSAVLFYCVFTIAENIMPVALACMLATALLWVLDWFFMYRNICIFRFIMKNKCCNTCRVYHFNYAMFSTPSIFIIRLNPFPVIFILLSFLHLLLGEICFRVRNYNRADTPSNNAVR